jgi:hypothetical protein
MAKFRKKPVVIEAVRWTGKNVKEILRFRKSGPCPPWWGNDFIIDNATRRLEIATLEGTMLASAGDWVIRGVKGEFYPCKPHIFDATYEPAPES